MADTTIALIQQQLRDSFPQVEQRVARYYAMMEYHLGWRDEALAPVAASGGKLLRPLLCLSACHAVGGTTEQALPAAAALQLIHDFSLIHDDIEDDSATRRGRATVWSIWGLAQGINVGDGMFALAHLALHRLHATGVPAERVLDALLVFDQTILTICEGQYLDIDNEGNLRVSEVDYLAMIGRKTAALIGACGRGRRRHARGAARLRFESGLGLSGARRPAGHLGRPRTHRQAFCRRSVSSQN
jgi:geranylgeranyl diphosphate synthase, type I